MTRGEFVGQHGVSAEIDGRLLIEYDGPCPGIEGFLRDVRRRSRIDADRPAAADVLQRLDRASPEVSRSGSQTL
jgi:hypothetical protein